MPLHEPHPRQRRAAAAPLAALLPALLLAFGPAPASAQAMRPWTPPAADSLLMWASEARVRFQANTGDSVGGDNYRAYDLVSTMARRMLHSLGPDRVEQALAIEGILDSLGLDTEIELDPELPHFVLLMVRNPFRLTAGTVGFFYWYRQNDLRVQGALFRGGVDPRMRVWWTGEQEAPYAWGIIDRMRAAPREMGLTFLRLHRDGYYWNLVQYPGDELTLGGPGEAAWVDIDRDGRPEIATWTRGEMDSTFEDCSECPELTAERTYVERRNGFRLQDSRLLPSPFSTFVLFIRLLQSDEHEGAMRLLADPNTLREALSLGWNRKGNGVWKYVNGEPGERWQRWMAMRFRPEGRRGETYIVRFTQHAGRWIIESWQKTGGAGGGPSSGSNG